MKKPSRMESNKEARRVLNKSGVDLSYCQFSCAGSDIRMTGWLCKYDGSDFNAGQIEGLVAEFNRSLPGYSVSGDFDNWSFNGENITYLGGDQDGVKPEQEENLFQLSLEDGDYEAS